MIWKIGTNIYRWNQEKDLKLVLTPVAKKEKEFDKPWTPLQINEV